MGPLGKAIGFLKYIENPPGHRQQAKVVYPRAEIRLLGLCLRAAMAGAASFGGIAGTGGNKRTVAPKVLRRG